MFVKFLMSFFNCHNTVSSVMADFNRKIKQLNDVAELQHAKAVRQAIIIEKAQVAQVKAEAEVAEAKRTVERLQSVIQGAG
jgi:alkyl hydroperoxide reductase subunit AhpC